MKCAVYGRVSTSEQEPENQLRELRAYADARGWTAVEYIDKGISGAKERRPALDALRVGGGSMCCWSGGLTDSEEICGT